MLFASVATGVRQGNIASFPAIRTIVESVCAQAHVVLPFADGAILFAGAIFFRLVAHYADDGTGHGSLQGKLYLTMVTCGKARVFWMRRSCTELPATRACDGLFRCRASRFASALRFFDACTGAC